MTNEDAIGLIDDMRRNAIGLMLGKKQIDALDMAIEALKAQDDSLNEWCTGCKEYDAEKHCCPRFNRVIRTALQDADLHSACTVLAQDTISRQALLDAFGLSDKTRKYGGDHSGYDTRMLYEIQDVIEGMPSAEPEIIRCKDCRYYHKEWDGTEPHHYEDYWCEWVEPCEDDYCSLAERRMDE